MTHSQTTARRPDLATVGDWIRWAASRFAEAGIFFGHGTQSAADEARALVFHALHLDFDCPDYFYGCAVTDEETGRMADLIDKRVRERKPLPYLTGEAWFCGLRFHVDERVLIPRSPIAELIEQRFSPWLPAMPAPRILDLCTGGACIAVACGHYFEDAAIDAADIDPDALEVARDNVAAHGLENRVRVLHSDLFDGLGAARYDLIVCNPPYVPAARVAALPAEYGHEPRAALTAGDDGLEIVRRLLSEAAEHLSDDGVLVVEVGESAAAVEAAFGHIGLAWCDFEYGGEGVFVIDATSLRNARKGDGKVEQLDRVG